MFNKKISTTTLISEMDENVKRMLKLIEDGDSFAKRGEMCYEKRPELLSLVKDFSLMYRSLAERHDNIADDIQSQSSCISEVGSELPSPCPSPDQPPTRRGSGDASSSLDFESESDGSTGSRNGNVEVFRPYARVYEEELRDVEEMLRLSGDAEKLKTEVSTRKYMNVRVHPEEEVERMDRCLEVVEQQEFRDESGIEQEVPPLEEDLRKVKFKLHDSEKEIAGLREALKKTQASELILQDQLRTMTADATFLKGKLDKEEREVSRLCDRITRYKSNLSDSDEEIRRLKEAIAIANKSLSKETMIKLQKEKSYLENNLKELDSRCKSLEEDLRRALAGKTEIKTTLGAEIERLKTMVTEKDDQVEELTKSLGAMTRNHNMLVAEKAKVGAKVDELTAEMSSKDDRIDAMCQHLHQLQTEQVKLMSETEGERKMAKELRSIANELETKVKQQQELLEEGAEEKREAIRQLSMSLDHYKVGYLRLRDVVVNQKRSPVS